MRAILTTAAFLFLMMVPAEARHSDRHDVRGYQSWDWGSNWNQFNQPNYRPTYHVALKKKRRHLAKRAAAKRAAIKRAAARHAAAKRNAATVARFSPPVAAMKKAMPVEAIKNTVEAANTAIRTPFGVVVKTVVRLDVLSPKLIDFTRKVAAACGPVKVISGLRQTGVPRTCHRTGEALDYQVADPACAMRVANQTRGIGHSNDYYGVAQKYGRGMPVHYHLSSCQREMNKRFAHGGGSKYRATRYAKRYKKRNTRYARA